MTPVKKFIPEHQFLVCFPAPAENLDIRSFDHISRGIRFQPSSGLT